MRRRDISDSSQLSSLQPPPAAGNLDALNSSSSSRRSVDRRRISETKNFISEEAAQPSSSSSSQAPWSLRTRQPVMMAAESVNDRAVSSTQSDGHLSDSFGITNTRATRSTRLSSSTTSSHQVPLLSQSQSQSQSSSSSSSHRSNNNANHSSGSSSNSNSNSNSRNASVLAEVTDDHQRSSSRRLDPGVKREMLKVISYADEIDAEKNIFAEPVRLANAPNYFEVVQNPIDRSTIRWVHHHHRLFPFTNTECSSPQG